jgi:subtilase family serine protease
MDIKKNKKTIQTFPKFVIPIAVLVLLSVFSTPVVAYGASYDYDSFPRETRSSGTINGGVFISYGDNDQMQNAEVKPYVTNFSVPNGTLSLTNTQPDLTVEDINAFHYDSGQNVWFNLTNEVNVTVNNTGDVDAGAFNVSLYANDTFIAKQSVSGLPSGNTTTLQFLWTPTGCDCDDDCSPVDYTLKAVADCDDNVAESNDSNNESTTVETVYWNGYTSDQPLEHIIHGTIRGGLYYTQGDGRYTGLYLPGYNTTATYDITLPDGADVALARLNVYYTWQKGTSKYPEMMVNITNSSGTYVLTLNASYNDSPCTGLAFTFPYGNYVYDVAPYISGSGSYTVDVKNNGPTKQSSNFCVAAPGIVILYEDSTKPEYEYWLIEGADLLEGGRRYGAGSLSLEECTSNATFTGDIDIGQVETATLGMVSAWGGSGGGWGDYPSLYWFNDNYLGNATIMVGYVSLYNRTVDGISMYVGASGNAQIGANVSDVTSYIASSDNTVSFGDDGDSMMPTNAFLMVEYKDEEEKPDLTVATIEPNCGGYLFGNESNEICAEVENVGAAAATLFKVSFEVDGFSEVVALNGLAAGANISVCVNDTTMRNAGDAVTITVTADCVGDVSENDETNNATTMNTTVVNNGYKGKRYTGGEDITTWETFELSGNLLYSVGDSYYLSATTYPHWTTYSANWTASDLPLDGANVREARLYVPYTWDKAGVMPNEASLTFNGNAQARAQHYSDDRVVLDSKPYGMLVYNVTADFNPTVNNAVLTNTHPGGGNVSIRGMLLVIICADDSAPERKIIINEGFDLLYGGASKCTTPAEATAYAPLGAIDLTGVEKATLITVAPGADGPEGDLLFNGQTWTDVWNFAGSTEIGIKEINVTSYLDATANEAGFQSNEDWMEASNAFLMVEYKVDEEKPDLIVSTIEPNCGGYLFGNESNEICAEVENVGAVAATLFKVSFEVDGFSEVVTLAGLAASANISVCVNDTTLRNAGNAVTITVTADCDGDVFESDETNNASTMNTTVVNNGYKGKRYTGGEDITPWKTFKLNGNLLYSVGDSQYVSGGNLWTMYNASWTASDLPVPDEVSIEVARLFVPYTWDKADVMPDNVSMSFNSKTQTLAAHYSDRKSYDGYNYPYGMLVYDVTADFHDSCNYANLTKSESSTQVSMRGMLLVVIYKDDSEPERKIFMNEGFDLLYGGSAKCTTPEEATAYAPIGAIALAGVEKATLITVAPGADGPEGDLLFNGQTWIDAWNFAGSTEIGINETNVTSYLNATDNEAGLRSSEDDMEASNTFLVLEYTSFDTGEQENPYPSIAGIHNGSIILNHTIIVNKLFTYSCPGTGGHSEYVAFYNTTTGAEIANGTWDSNSADWHTITFKKHFELQAGTIYNYTLKTGSYPQIVHAQEYNATGGKITCTKFTDVNGKSYDNWIPAIRLF